MKRFALLIAIFFLLSFKVSAQNFITTNITTAGSDCSTATSCAVLNLQKNLGGASFTVSGTFSGTLQFEASGDGVNYNSLAVTPLAGGTAVTSTTAGGIWVSSIAGLTQVRVRASALASGTAKITIQASTSVVSSPGATTVGNINNGSQYVVPTYANSGSSNVLGPTNITTDSSLNNLIVPGNLTVQSSGVPGGIQGTQQSSGCVAQGTGLNFLFLGDTTTGLPLWTHDGVACEPLAVQTYNATFDNLTVTGTCSGCGGAASVNSVSGDGTLITNSLSTGAVTLTLGNAGAHTFWGNNTGSTGAPGYDSITAADVPTLNQNTTGTAANLSGTPALPNGTTATTQTANDNSTKLATTAYVDGKARIWSCRAGLGDGLNAIPAGTYPQTTCYNDTGATVTITGVKCYADGGTPTMNVSGHTLGALLTGAVTCTTAYAAGTQSANVSLTSGDYLQFSFVADGTAKQTDWVVTGTY